MASIHRDPRSPYGVWYCCLATADGRRTWRSTKTRNKRQARILCDAWQQAEEEAATGHLTRNRAREILDETLKRLGLWPLEEAETDRQRREI